MKSLFLPDSTLCNMVLDEMKETFVSNSPKIFSFSSKRLQNEIISTSLILKSNFKEVYSILGHDEFYRIVCRNFAMCIISFQQKNIFKKYFFYSLRSPQNKQNIHDFFEQFFIATLDSFKIAVAEKCNDICVFRLNDMTASTQVMSNNFYLFKSSLNKINLKKNYSIKHNTHDQNFYLKQFYKLSPFNSLFTLFKHTNHISFSLYLVSDEEHGLYLISDDFPSPNEFESLMHLFISDVVENYGHKDNIHFLKATEKNFSHFEKQSLREKYLNTSLSNIETKKQTRQNSKTKL